jgi:hypothetical protein
MSIRDVSSVRLNDATPEEWDAVNRPRHYTTSEVECIDYIHMMLGSGVNDYLRGQGIQIYAPPPI